MGFWGSFCITCITMCITFNPSSSFVSSFLGFWRPVTIMHDLREYESSSSSWRERKVFTFRTIARSPSIAETVTSKRPNLCISFSIIFCCFLIISLDLLIWWFSCCWDVGARGAAGVSLMLVVQAFLGVFFFNFFVSYSSITHSKNFIIRFLLYVRFFYIWLYVLYLLLNT